MQVMQDMLYEVTLSPTQIDTIHGSLIAQEKLYSGVLAAVANKDKATLNWMLNVNIGEDTIQTIHYNVTQMLMQIDNFVLGTELPPEFDKNHTLVFKEAFEPFSEH